MATTALIIIGNEILSGRTKDTNTGYIGEKMAGHGVPLREVRVIPDVEETIIETVNEMRETYDYVMTTGGIGPTHDDITSASISKALGLEFERHQEAYDILEDYYGKDDFTEARATMADMPKGAKLLPNPVSGAPGFHIENIFVMAGVPRIMQGMLEHVIDQITPGDPILSNMISCNLQESIIAPKLGEIQNAHKTVDIGSYPGFRGNNLNVSVVVRGSDKAEIKTTTQEVLDLIEELDGEVQSLSLQVPMEE